MDELSISFTAIGLYFLSTACLAFSLVQSKSLWKNIAKVIAILALIQHGYLLYVWVDLSQITYFNAPRGQNLYVSNVLSLVVWVSVILIMLLPKWRSRSVLALFSLPLAAASIIIAQQYPGEHILFTSTNYWELIHIVLAVVTISIISLAGFQAMLIAGQNYLLKQKITMKLPNIFPPLESMEVLLFKILAIGFIGLSLVLVGSLFLYYRDQPPVTTHSPYLAIAAWLIFAILLFGHKVYGWRGKKAIHYTFLGVFMLMLSYFGYQIILQV